MDTKTEIEFLKASLKEAFERIERLERGLFPTSQPTQSASPGRAQVTWASPAEDVIGSHLGEAYDRTFGQVGGNAVDELNRTFDTPHRVETFTWTHPSGRAERVNIKPYYTGDYASTFGQAEAEFYSGAKEGPGRGPVEGNAAFQHASESNGMLQQALMSDCFRGLPRHLICEAATLAHFIPKK